MAEKLGWRGLSDDAQRVAFWITFWSVIMAAVIAGSVYGWWAWYWAVPAELKLGQGAGIVTATVFLFYALVITSHNYFGWPKHHPLHQKPTFVEKPAAVMSLAVPPMLRTAVPTVAPGGAPPQIAVVAYEGEEAILFVHNTGGDGVFTADAQIIKVDSGAIGHAAPYRMLWKEITTHKVIKGHEHLVSSDSRAKLLISYWESGGDWGKPSIVIIGDEWAVDRYRHDPWDKRSPTVTIEVTIKSVPPLTSPFKRQYSVHIPPKTLSKVVVVEHEGSITP